VSLPSRFAAVAVLVLLVAGQPLAAQADLTSPIDSSSAVLPRPSGPAIGANRLGIGPMTLPDTVRRPRAIEYSDMYYTRLTIHRWASYAELPLFAAEWIVGQQLINQTTTAGTIDRHSPLRSTHQAIASGLGALFAVNTVTGVWNLYESRHEPAGRVKRIVHSLLMLTADAGFMYTASTARNARLTTTGVNTHRNAAIASMGIATVSTLMMWFWKN
jgi:hypothetical protein